MKTSFKDGAIVTTANFYEKVIYDVGNKKATARFDGLCNIDRYAVMGKWNVFSNYYTTIAIDGVPVDFFAPKTVKMIGRTQTTSFSVNGVKVTSEQFLDSKTNAVICSFFFKGDRDFTAEVLCNFELDDYSYKSNFFRRQSALGYLRYFAGYIGKLFTVSKETLSDGVKVLSGRVKGDYYLDIAGNESLTALESEYGFCNQFKISAKVKAGSVKRLTYAVSSGTKGDFSSANLRSVLLNYELYSSENKKLNATLPSLGETERDKAMYNNLYACCVSSYKELGKFKGFIAGNVYQLPTRTYYRDSFWSSLPLVLNQSGLVRNEIVTLCRGVSRNGECPSAVLCNFKKFWGGHYDSPSMLALLLYIYVKHTGDVSILDEPISRKKTVLSVTQSVVDKLALKADSTSLIVKEGRYNRRDWCDNVFRTGYCSYDEILFGAALRALSKLFAVKGDILNAERFNERADKVYDAINKLLWDDKLGWYVNYKDGKFTEDNLSIDIIPAVLFGIADEKKSKRILENAQRLLESKNNPDCKIGDFGVMCVYPLYKKNDCAVHKSTYPYYYHNGGDWPYWDAAYAYAKYVYGMDYTYPLNRWFDFNIERNNFTPMEFYAPIHPDGSLMQSWSSLGAFTMECVEKGIKDFFKITDVEAKAQAEEATDELTSTDEPSVKETPVEKITLEKTPVETTDEKETPAEEIKDIETENPTTYTDDVDF